MLLKTPEADFGRTAPDFVLKDAHGMVHARDQVRGSKGVLVAFICNHCPYVIAIIDRLAQDMAALQEDGIGCVAIMSNDFAAYPADAPDRMVAFAARHKLAAPYLVDEDQSVAQAYGAVCTPDFFGFDADLTLRYRGRLDDALQGDATGRNAELLEAMRAIAAAPGVVSAGQVASMGCSIKWR